MLKIIKKIALALIGTLVIGIISVIYISDKVQDEGKKYIASIDDLPIDSDAIIVLGAGVRNDGTPSDILQDRLDTALDVHDKNISDTFLLTGDHGNVDYNEVGVMKKYIMQYGVKEHRVFLDHAGFNTYDSMYRAKEIFKVKKAIIVTNEYHLPRALYLARNMGINAYGVISDKRNYDCMASYKIREKLAQVKAYIYAKFLKPEPKFLGDEIPVDNSDGKITDDEI
ncbi:SanA/YdcF family protein [Clostridium tarantellae]|uniref:SanA protein n=1 Tax=Clostridium tarantellae TaxID=39493 RepID=A0A6I1MQQ7_9CLOT|nr:ElyC/SanA/YdcF family protein [Clostridium tarantellae]MPQ44572.1 SanA protein [Clostridium tarantellae]